MLAHVFASSDLDSLPSAEAMSFACMFLGNMCAFYWLTDFIGSCCLISSHFSRCKFQLFAIQATEYGLLAILMALISSPADEFRFNDLSVQHMQVCLTDSTALDGLLGRENRAHPKGSAVLQVFSFD
jgi:hypothetical protein